MGIGARVESLDALRWLKVAMAKFAEEASAALGNADTELQRTLVWLETEQLAHWQAQQRTRAQALSQARDALRNKALYKGVGGRTPSVVDEKKVVAVATRHLEEAEQKIATVKKWIPSLKKEITTYQSGVQALGTALQWNLPVAIGQLDRMIGSLEAYLELKEPAVSRTGEESPGQDAASPPETPPEPQGPRQPTA